MGRSVGRPLPPPRLQLPPFPQEAYDTIMGRVPAPTPPARRSCSDVRESPQFSRAQRRGFLGGLRDWLFGPVERPTLTFTTAEEEAARAELATALGEASPAPQPTRPQGGIIGRPARSAGLLCKPRLLDTHEALQDQCPEATNMFGDHRWNDLGQCRFECGAYRTQDGTIKVDDRGLAKAFFARQAPRDPRGSPLNMVVE